MEMSHFWSKLCPLGKNVPWVGNESFLVKIVGTSLMCDLPKKYDRYYCHFRSYKKRMFFFFLFYVFFEVESESEVSLGRSPLFFEL